jgi:Ion channel
MLLCAAALSRHESRSPPSGETMPRAAWIRRLQDPSLTALLLTLVLFIFGAVPLAALGVRVPSVIAAVLLFGLLVSTVLLSDSLGAIALVILSLAFGATGVAVRLRAPSPATEWLGHCAGIAAMLGVSVVVGRAVFRPGRVTHHRIQGAVVLYLNAALMFTAAYRLVSDLVPDAFRNLPAGGGEVGAFSTMLYFSFTTLTSTGFGDIVPVHPVARSLANLEAVLGQLYPATLLARLVTLELEGRRR